ncbi:MAG: ABC transporter permease, partial [Cetobacterium sp.]
FNSSGEPVRVLETPEVYKKVERIKSYLNRGLLILSIVSLTVGGVGVLNLIAQSIRERGAYIGILRTMGMNKKMLVEIFLIEAGVVVVGGAVIGVLAGILASLAAGTILGIPPSFGLWKIFCSLIATSTLGITFGLLPLKKIKELEIVEALKI